MNSTVHDYSPQSINVHDIDTTTHTSSLLHSSIPATASATMTISASINAQSHAESSTVARLRALSNSSSYNGLTPLKHPESILPGPRTSAGPIMSTPTSLPSIASLEALSRVDFPSIYPYPSYPGEGAGTWPWLTMQQAGWLARSPYPHTESVASGWPRSNAGLATPPMSFIPPPTTAHDTMSAKRDRDEFSSKRPPLSSLITTDLALAAEGKKLEAKARGGKATLRPIRSIKMLQAMSSSLGPFSALNLPGTLPPQSQPSHTTTAGFTPPSIVPSTTVWDSMPFPAPNHPHEIVTSQPLSMESQGMLELHQQHQQQGGMEGSQGSFGVMNTGWSRGDSASGSGGDYDEDYDYGRKLWGHQQEYRGDMGGSQQHGEEDYEEEVAEEEEEEEEGEEEDYRRIGNVVANNQLDKTTLSRPRKRYRAESASSNHSSSTTGASLSPTPSPRLQASTSTGTSKSTRAPLKCPIPGCPKPGPYPTAAALKSHRVNSHKRRREFPCLHPGCDRVLYRKQDRDRHLSTHSTFKEFQCEHCGRRFTRRDGMTRHLAKDRCPALMRE
ncbi:hypothetical protein HDU97_007491 [Phlyctochytrium planicorne]|nr:hypothetical protein HDU97_007491 [Phlyctochytrium planicorne]